MNILQRTCWSLRSSVGAGDDRPVLVQHGKGADMGAVLRQRAPRQPVRRHRQARTSCRAPPRCARRCLFVCHAGAGRQRPAACVRRAAAVPSRLLPPSNAAACRRCGCVRSGRACCCRRRARAPRLGDAASRAVNFANAKNALLHRGETGLTRGKRVRMRLLSGCQTPYQTGASARVQKADVVKLVDTLS